MKINPFFMIMRKNNDVWFIEQCDNIPIIRVLNPVSEEAQKDMRELECYLEWMSNFMSSDSELGIFKIEGFNKEEVTPVLVVAGKCKSGKDIDINLVVDKQYEANELSIDLGYFFTPCGQDLSYATEHLKDDSVVMLENGQLAVISVYPNVSEEKIHYMLMKDIVNDDAQMHPLKESALLLGRIEAC